MTWVDASISTWVTSGPIGAPYIGGGSWGVSLAFWRPQSRSRVWSWMRSWWRATSGLAERRRTASELRTWAGRQKRGRRAVLAGWDRRARQRALERGRERAR